MSLCLRRENGEGRHKWLKEVSISKCSLWVIERSRNWPGQGIYEHLLLSPRERQAYPGRVSDCMRDSTHGRMAVAFVQMLFSHFIVIPFRYWVTLTMLSQPSLLLKSC